MNKNLIYLFYFIEKFLRLFTGFFLSKRKKFEVLNFTKPGSQKFSRSANLAVEFSSEGEFEQIRFVLTRLLGDPTFLIELIYFSESVEGSVNKFIEAYPNQVRSFRFPVATSIQSLYHWVTAPIFILVRYDFFPSIFILGMSKKFILLSCDAAKVQRKGFLSKFAYSVFYSQFDFFFCARAKDQRFLKEVLNVSALNTFVSDFRINRIRQRQDLAPSVLADSNIAQVIEKILRDSIVFGSFWNDEFEHLWEMGWAKCLSDGVRTFILPHQINQSNTQELITKLQDKNIKFVVVTPQEIIGDMHEAQVFICNLKGILCELYTLFRFAYVGGGVRGSVHSVLEPYLGGAKVFTGEGITRSSEFDMIKEIDPDFISILSKEQNLHIGMQSWENKSRVELLVGENSKALDQLLRIIHE